MNTKSNSSDRQPPERPVSSLQTIAATPLKITEIPDLWITLADGCRLSARMWLPTNAKQHPVPAILEYLPYRKRDGTTGRDALTHPWFAGHGYACLRVDIRGNGDSEGLMLDEYTEQELSDACEVIDWIASQSWCTGRVGMMGISWGGFNSLQVAALRPEPLKAIVTLCSTDDRYADDIHYKGGCLLNENLGWGATMLCYSSRPPDPIIAGQRWRELWLERLENEPLLPAVWLRHQTRDDYWKHGSICENYAKINAATLAVGGWGDAYKNSIPRLLENLSAPAKGITGPWIHKYPHFAVPEPKIGFLQEARRWWDQWLKDIDTGVAIDPAYRAYLMDSVRPKSWYERREGRWISEVTWPSANIQPGNFHLTGSGTLDEKKAAPFETLVCSPQDNGLQGGEYCAIWLGPELPTDQRRDDALSVCFDTVKLPVAHDIVGAPTIRFNVSATTARASIAVRLCDVHPDGASTRITYGVLNLCHHTSHEHPQLLTPGTPIQVTLQLDDIAYRVPAGHLLRVAVSSCYWPLLWPAPESATLTITEGTLTLPLRTSSEITDEWQFEPAQATPAWQTEVLRKPGNQRRVVHDQVSGETTLIIEDDFGLDRDADHGLVSGGIARETWTIHPDDPLSARGATHWTSESGRNDWHTRTETYTNMSSDKDTFTITARIEAYEQDELVFEKDFKEQIPRGFL